HALPHTPENTWMQSLIEKHPDLKQAISEHLQSVSKYVRAMDIVHFMAEPANLLQFNITKPVSLSIAQVWMHTLEYQWTKTPSG
ncbi:hypothetical protein C8Q74DRAFT_1187813, partial [Fomes fomentarius]